MPKGGGSHPYIASDKDSRGSRKLQEIRNPLVSIRASARFRINRYAVDEGLDAMPRGGTLSCNAFPGFSGNEAVVIILYICKDMSSQILEKVFQPFFNTKRDGIGLELCPAEQVVSSHKGKVAIRSKAGHGTAIAKTFPMSQRVDRENIC